MDPDSSKVSNYCDNLLLADDKIGHGVFMVWNSGMFAIRGVFLGMDCWIGEELEVVGTERRVIDWFEREIRLLV